MIDEIRSYFKGVIKSVDSDLRYDDRVGDEEKIGLSALNRTYKFYFGAMEPSIVDGTIQSLVPVTAIIYKKLGVDEPTDYDKAYCKAIHIHALAQEKSNYDQTGFIKNVECTSITPEPIDDDDKTYRFTLQFNVTIAYRYSE
jgi:hypothetical protein